MYMRIRKAREDAGYTREKFAELLDVSVSYMAEVERGRTGISVKSAMCWGSVPTMCSSEKSAAVTSSAPSA